MTKLKLIVLFFFAYSAYINYVHAEEHITHIQEQRLNALYNVILCPTCQGQSLKDSRSTMARILRDNIRHQLLQGKSDQDIVANLKSTYGERISFEPETNLANSLLWLLPFLVLTFCLFKFKCQIKI